MVFYFYVSIYMKNYNKITEKLILVDNLLEGNIYDNFVHMSPEDVKVIDRKVYKEKMDSKLDEILEKDEIKTLFMWWIEWFQKHMKPNEINKIMEDAAEKSNLFWKEKDLIHRNIYKVAHRFRNKWLEIGQKGINYDNLKKSIKEFFAYFANIYAEILPNQYKNEEYNVGDTQFIPKGTEDKIGFLIDGTQKLEESIQRWIMWWTMSQSRLKFIIDNVLLQEIKKISSYISVAEWEEKEKLEQIFEKNVKFYEETKKYLHEMTEKEMNVSTDKTGSSLLNTIQ